MRRGKTVFWGIVALEVLDIVEDSPAPWERTIESFESNSFSLSLSFSRWIASFIAVKKLMILLCEVVCSGLTDESLRKWKNRKTNNSLIWLFIEDCHIKSKQLVKWSIAIEVIYFEYLPWYSSTTRRRLDSWLRRTRRRRIRPLLEREKMNSIHSRNYWIESNLKWNKPKDNNHLNNKRKRIYQKIQTCALIKREEIQFLESGHIAKIFFQSFGEVVLLLNDNKAKQRRRTRRKGWVDSIETENISSKLNNLWKGKNYEKILESDDESGGILKNCWTSNRSARKTRKSTRRRDAL